MTIDLNKRRRIRRKVAELGGAIQAAGDLDEYHNNPIQYLESKSMTKPVTYTVEDIAEVLHVTPDSVRRWIREGKMQAARIGNGYVITRTELERYWASQGGTADLFGPTDQGADDE